MTTELEKQFFDTFGIEPKLNDCNWQCQKPSKLIYMCANNNNCEHCKEYPQITDRHYLELICLYVNTNDYFKCFADIEKINFRNQILEKYIANKRFFDKHQVQAIFDSNQ